MSSNETFIRFFTRCTRAEKEKQNEDEKIENLWDCLGQLSWSWREKKNIFAFSLYERLFKEEIRLEKWTETMREFLPSLSKLKNLLN